MGMKQAPTFVNSRCGPDVHHRRTQPTASKGVLKPASTFMAPRRGPETRQRRAQVPTTEVEIKPAPTYMTSRRGPEAHYRRKKPPTALGEIQQASTFMPPRYETHQRCIQGNAKEFKRLITQTRHNTIIRDIMIPKGPPPSEVLPTHEDLMKAEAAKRLHVLEREHTCQQLRAEAEKEAEEIRQRLLDRAHYLRMEQEYDVRNFNSEIKGAKFRTLNLAKIEENKLLQEQFLKKEKELDALDHLTNKKFWDAIDERERRQREFRIERRKCIGEQILQNMEKKKLHVEMNRLEGQRYREQYEAKRMQLLMDKKRKREEYRRKHEDILKVNEVIMNKERRRREEERMENMKFMENMLRMEMTEKNEDELKRLKKAKDRIYVESCNQHLRERQNIVKKEREEEKRNKYWTLDYHLEKDKQIYEHKKRKIEDLRASGLLDVYYMALKRKAGVEAHKKTDDILRDPPISKTCKIKISENAWSYM